MKRAAFAAIIVLIGPPVLAADMAVKAPVYKAPPAVAIAPWTGCYVGGNLGYGWAPKEWSSAGVEFASHTADGVAGGGQIGCDYQTGAWVFGIQGMFDGSGMKGESHKVVGALGPNIFDQSQVTWFSTLTGLIGYAIQPTLLLYVKGGVAWVRDNYQECCLTTPQPTDDGIASQTRSGGTIGVGLEYMFLPNWSAFAEYNYIGLGTRAVTFTPTGLTTGGPFVYDIRQNVQSVLAGVNYHFGRGF
jgi:outer membrane immunogenic protein